MPSLPKTYAVRAMNTKILLTALPSTCSGWRSNSWQNSRNFMRRRFSTRVTAEVVKTSLREHGTTRRLSSAPARQVSTRVMHLNSTYLVERKRFKEGAKNLHMMLSAANQCSELCHWYGRNWSNMLIIHFASSEGNASNTHNGMNS